MPALSRLTPFAFNTAADTHSWIHFLPCPHRLMDLPELVSLTALRALFVQSARKTDSFRCPACSPPSSASPSFIKRPGIPISFLAGSTTNLTAGRSPCRTKYSTGWTKS